MPRFRVRAEFRRRDREAPWVLAGIIVDEGFWPAVEGVERIRERLPMSGLVGWQDLPTPVLAPDPTAAAAIGLEIVRAHWPERVRPTVPYAAGTRDSS